MIIDCISDLHGKYPQLEGGDLLIVAGDLTGIDSFQGYLTLQRWLNEQEYSEKIIIGGNHDTRLQNTLISDDLLYESSYLLDLGKEFEGLKIWGSPWTLKFEGQNPHAMAFALDTEEQLSQKWNLIPENIDILVTHSPAYGVLDKVNNRWKSGIRVGSTSLKDRVMKIKPKLHVFGHIHGSYGKIESSLEFPTIFVNASHVTEDYEPLNKPIRIIFP